MKRLLTILMLTGISLVSFAEDGKTLPSAEINGITYTAVADAEGNATSEACVSGGSVSGAATVLSTVKLNDGKTYTVTSIKEDAFKDNTLLTSITLPSTVTTIEATAFEGSALTAINIPEGLTKIGAAAFRRTKLSSIVLPSTVKEIRANAFEASSLQSADLSAAQ